MQAPVRPSGFLVDRLDFSVEVGRYVPTRIDVTGGANTGDQDERYVLRQSIQPDHCYILDRGYAKFSLFNAIAAAQSSYVCRVRDNTSHDVLQERALSDEARQADVVGDYRVSLGQNRSQKDRPDHPVRLVVVKTTPHVNRGKYRGGSTGNASDGYLRLQPTCSTCRHLLSTDPVGVEIQAYCAIIACMLISLWTGRKPTKRTFEMICYYFIGWADEEELLRHIEKLKKHDA